MGPKTVAQLLLIGGITMCIPYVSFGAETNGINTDIRPLTEPIQSFMNSLQNITQEGRGVVTQGTEIYGDSNSRFKEVTGLEITEALRAVLGAIMWSLERLLTLVKWLIGLVGNTA